MDLIATQKQHIASDQDRQDNTAVGIDCILYLVMQWSRKKVRLICEGHNKAYKAPKINLIYILRV